MAYRVFKRADSSSYQVDFRDHLGIEHRLAAYRDKRLTHELVGNLKRLVLARAHQERPDPSLSLWLKTLPKRIRKQLLKWEIIDSRHEAQCQPLNEHLAEFEAALIAKGNTSRHARQQRSRAERLLTGCGFASWNDITANKVHQWLHQQQQARKDKAGNRRRGLSKQTANYYLQAAKGFCQWMVRDRRAMDNPLAHLQGWNARTDRRHDRRALSVEELRRLLTSVQSGPDRLGMSGAQRALLYRLALETGLRASELRSLTRQSFALDDDPPTVTVQAAYTKRRREDSLPLRPELVASLAEHLKHKAPATAAFDMPRPDGVVAMIKADLDAARAAWLNEAKHDPPERRRRTESGFLAYCDPDTGRYVDFHALRHTFISNLAASGVHPKVAQALARHSSITLTMDRYSHTMREQEKAAIAALPDLTTRPPSQQLATGTTGNSAAAENVREIVRIWLCTLL